MLFWSVLSLLALAVIMVNSTAMGVGDDGSLASRLLFGRPTLYAALAIAVMWITSRLDLRRVYTVRGVYNPILWMLLLAMALCALVLLPGVGAVINSSARWLKIGYGAYTLTFQPSELAKWALVAALAWWCARRSGAMRHFAVGLAPALLITGLVCGLVVIEDLGTAVLMGVVAVALLIAGGARVWQLALMLPVAAAGVVAMIYHSPYRLQRLLTFLDPYADAQNTGYQSVQMMAAIAGGNRGLGNGIAKQGYLPADVTDGIFAIICEELGLAGAVLVVALLATAIWSMFGILGHCRWAFGRLLILGVMLTVGVQAVMNIAVVTVVVPTKGIALPFVSSGGTGWVIGAAAVGLVIAIDRINALEADQPAPQPLGNGVALPMREAGL